MRLHHLIATIAIACASPAWALSSAPEIKQSGEIRYTSGGVGAEERETIDNMAQDFDVKLMFSSVDGFFLANANVTVKDNRGNVVLNTVTDGPILLMDAPAGHYTVEARVDGKPQSTSFTVNDTTKAKPVYLSWQVKDENRQYTGSYDEESSG